MKITFTCKLKLFDEIPDDDIEGVYSADEIVKTLVKDLKDGLTEKGSVELTDSSVTVE
jgi:hypothetical protein